MATELLIDMSCPLRVGFRRIWSPSDTGQPRDEASAMSQTQSTQLGDVASESLSLASGTAQRDGVPCGCSLRRRGSKLDGDGAQCAAASCRTSPGLALMSRLSPGAPVAVASAASRVLSCQASTAADEEPLDGVRRAYFRGSRRPGAWSYALCDAAQVARGRRVSDRFGLTRVDGAVAASE